MKIFFLLFAILSALATDAQPIKQKVTISITKTTPYCGGANPPAEVLTEASTPRIPYGEKFYLIKGTLNIANRKIIKTITMDAAGTCAVWLPAGTYSIINAFGFNKMSTDKTRFDISCLTAVWKKPLCSFTVKPGKRNTVSYNIDEVCPYAMPCQKGGAMPM
jgi:hypothetical protein